MSSNKADNSFLPPHRCEIEAKDREDRDGDEI
jgi:hypothetical protein